MSSDIKTKLSDAAGRAMPWQKGVAWWLVFIEGLVLLAIGLYIFFTKPIAFTAIGWAIALALLASGGLSLYLSLRAPQNSPARQWTLIHGAVGVAAGALAILLQLLNALSVQMATIILGVGCLAYGLIGLYMLIDKNLVALRRVSWLGTLLFTSVGTLLVFQALGLGTFATVVQFINLIIVIAGLALLVWAFVLKNSEAA